MNFLKSKIILELAGWRTPLTDDRAWNRLFQTLTSRLLAQDSLKTCIVEELAIRLTTAAGGIMSSLAVALLIIITRKLLASVRSHRYNVQLLFN